MKNVIYYHIKIQISFFLFGVHSLNLRSIFFFFLFGKVKISYLIVYSLLLHKNLNETLFIHTQNKIENMLDGYLSPLTINCPNS